LTFTIVLSSGNEKRRRVSGYALTITTNIADYRSEARVFDARQITAGPIARIELPARVAAGCHAAWFTGESLWPDQAPAVG
jgi:carotenoid cleavage dioxygenase